MNTAELAAMYATGRGTPQEALDQMADEDRRLELLRDGEEAEAQQQATAEAEGMTPLGIAMRREIDAAFDRALG